MKSFYYILSGLIAFASCNPNSANSELPYSKDTAIATIDDPRITKSNIITFEDYFKTGLILPCSLKLLNNEYTQVGEIVTDSILQIEIIAKSKERHSIIGDDTICNKSFYLKVKYKGDEFIVFGRYVYEIIETELFIVNHQAEDFEIFPVSNFQLKAFEENFGLTGCETYGYNIPVIKRLRDNHYSLIKDQGERTPSPPVQLPYAVLLQNSGVLEKINNVNVESDTIVLEIKTSYQMAEGSYKLKILCDDSLSTSIMSDRNEKTKY